MSGADKLASRSRTSLKAYIKELEKELAEFKGLSGVNGNECDAARADAKYWRDRYEQLLANVLNPPRNARGHFLPRSEWI